MNNPSTQITEYSETEAQLANLRKQLDGVLFDCTTPAGLKEAKDSKMLLVKVRTGLEKIRVEIKAPALERTQAIDSEARRITGEIHKLEDPILKQIQLEITRQAELKAKAARDEREKAEKWIRKIEAIKRRPLDFISSAPQDILAALVKARGIKDQAVNSFPEELQQEAEGAFTQAIKQMEQMHIAALDRADLQARADAAPQPEQSESVQTPTATGNVQQAENGSARSIRPTPVILVKGEGIPMEAPYVESGVPGARADDPNYWKAMDALLICSKATVDHFGKFKKPHETIVTLKSAIENLEAV